MKIFWSGFPGPCGGANVEAWHTAKMLRANGVEVTFIPTAGADLQMKGRLEGIGCEVVLGDDGKPIQWEQLAAVPGVKGSVVVSMCNSHFIKHAHFYRDLGCPIIWINCMTFCFPDEIQHYRRYGNAFDAYLFQSVWQQQQITPRLESHGYTEDRGFLVRGAFAVDEFPFEPLPHEREHEFVIGRLSRAAEDKYSSNTFPIYQRVMQAVERECPVRARVMAWDGKIERKCGTPDKHGVKADLLKSCAEPAATFLRSLHAMVQVNGGAGENWPRSGLEAMATGVPIVVQNQWGWQEMLVHGVSGFLCDNDAQLAFHAARLAVDEDLRLRVAANARERVEKELAAPEEIWDGWQKMLERVAT